MANADALCRNPGAQVCVLEAEASTEGVVGVEASTEGAQVCVVEVEASTEGVVEPLYH